MLAETVFLTKEWGADMIISKTGEAGMKKQVDTTEYLDMVCGLLEEGHTAVPVLVAGGSMAPFLHHGDTVYLQPPKPPLKRGDIVLYTRPGGQYVLHRIVGCNPDGSFLLLGDAQSVRERVESADRIRGRVAAAQHRGRMLTPQSLRWRFFATVWIWLRLCRRRLMGLISACKHKTR